MVIATVSPSRSPATLSVAGPTAACCVVSARPRRAPASFTQPPPAPGRETEADLLFAEAFVAAAAAPIDERAAARIAITYKHTRFQLLTCACAESWVLA